MDLLERIDALIAERHLLKHPFYTKWRAGELTRDELQEYARQYYAFESTFPRLLSALHTRSDEADVRQSLLDNLWDEEHGEVNHAEMWLRFGEGIGVERSSVRSAPANDGHAGAARHLLVRRDATAPIAAGIAALYAYEGQVPEVATEKIRGLVEQYGDRRPADAGLLHGPLDPRRRALRRGALDDRDAGSLGGR